MWPIDFTDEYQEWFSSLDEEVREAITSAVMVLSEIGPVLGRPHADQLKGSSNPKLKELIVQHGGRPIRIAFIFGRNRHGLLLCGGIKDGPKDKQFYPSLIREAEGLIDRYRP